MRTLKYLALVGNALFILWIVYNGINAGSRTVGKMEIVSLTALLLLLILNVILLWKSK